MHKPIAGSGDRHRGWRHSGNGRRRWLEPFVLLLIAEGKTHGYGITAGLQSMGVSGPELDVGQVYRVLRNLEGEGSVVSAWATDVAGPARREYRLTPGGWSALREWAAVMDERRRLSIEYLEHYGRIAEREHMPERTTEGNEAQ
jgi:PadR family transcriptional regulator